MASYRPFPPHPLPSYLPQNPLLPPLPPSSFPPPPPPPPSHQPYSYPPPPHPHPYYYPSSHQHQHPPPPLPPPSAPPPPPLASPPPPPPSSPPPSQVPNERDKEVSKQSGKREHAHPGHGPQSKHHRPPVPQIKKSGDPPSKVETEEERRLRKKREFEKQRQDEKLRQQMKTSHNNVLLKTQLASSGKPRSSIFGSRMEERKPINWRQGRE